MNVKRNSFIRHSGTKGSKWGYSKGSKNGKRTAKTNDEMADDVIKGKYGSGEDRVKTLTKAGYNAKPVQALVNKKMSGSSTKSSKNKSTKSKTKTKSKKSKSTEEIVKSVINGKYGNGKKRMSELKKSGYNYSKIQNLVNVKLLGKTAAKRIQKRRNS